MFKAISGIALRRLARRWLPLASIPLVLALALGALALRAQPHPVAATVPACSTPDGTGGASPCPSAPPSAADTAAATPSDTPAATPTPAADPTPPDTPQPTATPFPSTGESAVLIPCGASSGDDVGSAVAITPDGSEVVTGAAKTNNGDGAAYVLTRASDGWREDARLTVTDARDGGFGSQAAVSADGATALVAAPVSGSGRVYVFSRGPLGWAQTAELKSPNANGGTDLFGNSVSLSADGLTAAIAKPGYFTHGTAYVFRRSGSVWSLATTLTATVPEDNDWFGGSVALDAAGTRLILGYPSKGTVEVYDLNAGQWTRTSKLSDPQAPHLGNLVAVSADGGTVAAGDSDFYGSTASVAVFVDSAGSWGSGGTIHKPGQPNGMYGIALSLSANGSRALIGDDGGTVSGGLAYLADSTGGSWSSQQELKNPLPGQDDAYGFALAMNSDGSVAAVGGGAADGTGAVVLFDGTTPNPPRTVHC